MTKKYKDWYKSKTIWMNSLVLLIGILTAILGELEAGGTITSIAVLNIVFRFITKSQIL